VKTFLQYPLVAWASASLTGTLAFFVGYSLGVGDR
jgi:hypothetical protein